MKTKDLLSVLKKMKKIKASALPILDNVLNDNGTLTFTNLEVTYTANVGFAGKFLTDFKQLEKIASRIPKDSEIEMISNNERVTLQILIGRGFGSEKGGVFTLATENTKDYPVKPDTKESIGKLAPEDIGLIKKAVKFVDDNEGRRPAMGCVYCGEKHIVASNAHKLCYFKYSKGLTKPVLIPDFCVALLDDSEYTVQTGEMRACLQNDKESINFRFPDANYPKYEQVIPTNNTNVYEVNTKKLIEVIKLAEISANQNAKLIKFNFVGHNLTVSSQDLDFATSFSQSIPCAPQKNAESIKIGFNSDFILEILSYCGESTTIKMSDPSRAALFNNDLLLMPMMIQD
jgi:DNA polymerase-3 subunit beta